MTPIPTDLEGLKAAAEKVCDIFDIEPETPISQQSNFGSNEPAWKIVASYLDREVRRPLLSERTALEERVRGAELALDQFHEHEGWTANHIAQRLFDRAQSAEASLSALKLQLERPWPPVNAPEEAWARERLEGALESAYGSPRKADVRILLNAYAGLRQEVGEVLGPLARMASIMSREPEPWPDDASVMRPCFAFPVVEGEGIIRVSHFRRAAQLHASVSGQQDQVTSEAKADG